LPALGKTRKSPCFPPFGGGEGNKKKKGTVSSGLKEVVSFTILGRGKTRGVELVIKRGNREIRALYIPRRGEGGGEKEGGAVFFPSGCKKKGADLTLLRKGGENGPKKVSLSFDDGAEEGRVASSFAVYSKKEKKKSREKITSSCTWLFQSFAWSEEKSGAWRASDVPREESMEDEAVPAITRPGGAQKRSVEQPRSSLFPSEREKEWKEKNFAGVQPTRRGKKGKVEESR